MPYRIRLQLPLYCRATMVWNHWQHWLIASRWMAPLAIKHKRPNECTSVHEANVLILIQLPATILCHLTTQWMFSATVSHHTTSRTLRSNSSALRRFRWTFLFELPLRMKNVLSQANSLDHLLPPFLFRIFLPLPFLYNKNLLLQAALA